MNAPARMSHEDALDVAPLYVLGALDRAELDLVRDHLASCPLPHPEFPEMGAVVAHLADAVEPLDAPPELRARILERAAADLASRPLVRTASRAETAATTGSRPTAALRARLASVRGLRFGATAAALVLMVALAAWNLQLRSRLDETSARLGVLGDAIGALAAPDAQVARIAGTGTAEAASGFAAVPMGRQGFIVMVGLPERPAGKGYQAWFMTDVATWSPGFLARQANGPAVLAGIVVQARLDRVEVTLEDERGAERPTSPPLAVGTFDPRTGTLTLVGVPPRDLSGARDDRAASLALGLVKRGFRGPDERVR